MSQPQTPSTADLLEAAHVRLVELLGTSPGLDDELAAVRTTTEPVQRAREALRGVEERAGAYADAIELLAGVSDALTELIGVMPYSAEGWPEARRELMARMTADPATAASAWFGFWLAAVAQFRFDATERLRRDVPLPAELAVLEQRTSAAERGIAVRRWSSVAPVLRLGLPGAGRALPAVLPQDAADDVRLVLARVALACRQHDEARELLADAGNGRAAGAALALRARLSRVTGSSDDEDYERARDVDPRDLDVANETVTRMRSAGDDLAAALDAARVAVDAVPSAADVTRQLDRLIEPVAELWLAAADRALRDQNVDAAGIALDRAAHAAAAVDPALHASIRERRALTERDEAARLEQLIRAGELREQAGQFAEAKSDYAAVLEVSPALLPVDGDVTLARLSWARTVMTLAFVLPVDSMRDDLKRAIAVCEATDPLLSSPDHRALSFAIQSELHERMSQAVGTDRPQHRWEALLTGARAAALLPDSSTGWLSAADGARNLSLYRFALFAAAAGMRRGSGGINESTQHIAALINAGFLEDGLAALDEVLARTDLNDMSLRFATAMRGYALAKAGRHAEAVSVLETIAIEPIWSWAWETLLTSLAVLDRWSQAIEVATANSRRLHDAGETFAAARADYQIALLTGRFEDAIGYAGMSLSLAAGDEMQSRIDLLDARALTGDVAAFRELVGLVADGKAGGTIRTFRNSELPFLTALARRYRPAGDVPWQGLDAELVDPDVEQELADAARDELAAAAATATAPAARAAAALGAVLLGSETAAGVPDFERVVAAHLAEVQVYGPELDSLRSSVAQAQRRSTGPRESPGATGDLQAAADVPAAPADDRPILDLPPSWFSGHERPLETHPLFVRFLPEARDSEQFPFPALLVRVDEELEPDRYRLTTATGELLASGRADQQLRYLPSQETPVRTAEGAAVPVAEYDGRPAVRDADLAADARELLTWSPAEIVTRGIAGVQTGVAAVAGVPAP
jgi:tetratricopeptide (TPR) repeat protein